MYSKRLFQEVLLLLAALCVVQAFWLDFSKPDAQGLNKRQIGDIIGGGSSSSKEADPASASPSSPASSPSSVASSPTSKQAPSSSPSSSEPSSTPFSSSTPVATPTSSTPVSSSVAPQSTSSSSSKVAAPTSSDTSVASTSSQVPAQTSGGGTQGASSSAGGAKATPTPGINSQDGDSSSSGMSTKTRNTVIGVVVGIGGAIVIGALGVVAWRIWGRKKHSEENDGLMAYDMSSTGIEKSERGSSSGGATRTPFQSTLENYHQPGHVTASSNF